LMFESSRCLPGRRWPGRSSSSSSSGNSGDDAPLRSGSAKSGWRIWGSPQRRQAATVSEPGASHRARRFEQFQTAKFVGCHLGGGICEVIGRMDYAYTSSGGPPSTRGLQPLTLPPNHGI
jgi:hypothetical protein